MKPDLGLLHLIRLTSTCSCHRFLHAAGLSLQMPVDEQESHTLLDPEIFQKSETNVRKIDGCPGPLPAPRLPHQEKKKCYRTQSVETKATVSPTISAIVDCFFHLL